MLVRLRTWVAIVSTLIISLFLLLSLQLPGESIPFQGADLAYGPGAKAALFALASGALFVLSWLPDPGTTPGVLAFWLNRIALAGTFFLTGWYWLNSAVSKDPWAHLSFPLIGTILISVILLVTVAFLYFVVLGLFSIAVQAIRWFRNR